MAVPVGAPDHALLTLARDGDGEAFEALYRRHHRAATRAAHSYSSRGQLAEDAVQEAFLRILNTTQRGGGPENEFRAYLATTVRHVIAGWTRNDQTVASDDLEALAGEDTRESSRPESRLRWHLLTKAFKSLPTRWQEALWLGEVEGVSVAELAERWNMAPNSAAALAYRAREGLRTAWLEAHINEGLVPDECRPFVTDLGRYQQNKLSERRNGQVRDHLEDCGYCRAVLLEVGQAASELRVLLLPVVLGGSTAVAAAGGVGVGLFGAKGSGNTTRSIVIGAASVAAVAVVALALALIQPWAGNGSNDASGSNSQTSASGGGGGNTSGSDSDSSNDADDDSADENSRDDDADDDADGSGQDDDDADDDADEGGQDDGDRTSSTGRSGTGTGTANSGGTGTGGNGGAGTGGAGTGGAGASGTVGTVTGGTSGPGTGGSATANPAAPVVGVNTTISGSTATLTGSATAGAQITVVDTGGTPFATTSVGSNGRWTLAVTSDRILQPAGLTLRATQTVDGAVSPASAPFTLRNAVPTPGVSVQAINGASATLAGTAEPGATVQVAAVSTVGGGQRASSIGPRIVPAVNAAGSTVANADGSWELVVSDPQICDEGGIVLQATQTVANTTSPASALVTVYNDVPAPQESAEVFVDGIEASVSGTGDAGNTVTVQTEDGEPLGSGTVNGEGGWDVVVTDERIGSEPGLAVQATQTKGTTTSLASDSVTVVNPVPIPSYREIIKSDGATLVLVGGGEPGALLAMLGPDDAQLGTTIVGEDGTWILELTHADFARRGVDARFEQTVDGVTSAPSTVSRIVNPLPSPVGNFYVVRDAAYFTDGTGTPGATVHILDTQGKVLASAEVSEDGTWETKFTDPRIPGLSIYGVQTKGDFTSAPTGVAVLTPRPLDDDAGEGDAQQAPAAAADDAQAVAEPAAEPADDPDGDEAGSDEAGSDEAEAAEAEAAEAAGADEAAVTEPAPESPDEQPVADEAEPVDPEARPAEDEGIAVEEEDDEAA
ncbi:MAG: sigma-70 family RNA polymerase sigma factor [Beutenbergiaceae bacterium]